MVDTAEERVEKYDAKYDPYVVMLRWKALSDFCLEKFMIPSFQHYILDKNIQQWADEFSLPYGKIGVFHDKLKKLIYIWDRLTDEQKQSYRQEWIDAELPEELFDRIPEKLEEILSYYYVCHLPKNRIEMFVFASGLERFTKPVPESQLNISVEVTF
jgi:hypothetical protein